MHQPHYESQCKKCLGHASALRRELVLLSVSGRPVWDMASSPIDESQCKTCLGHDIGLDYSKWFNWRFIVYIEIRELMTMCAAKVARGSSPYVGEASHTISEAIDILLWLNWLCVALRIGGMYCFIGRDTLVCLGCVEDTAFGHGCVPWPCASNWLLTSEIESQYFCTRPATRACDSRVRDTGCRHGRVLDRAKTPIGLNLEFNSHGLGARTCLLVLRPCEPYRPSAQPGQNGHTGVLSFHTGVCPYLKLRSFQSL
ncbi:Aerobic cobaltochelatase subunit CobS [Gossypium arboreum]|uniref:Aerobic cobaltochelatase subunit CobS n=1 Tax=Gossypium arboreum TaxID=29729 RepID=A0A0B0NKB5_GOSAR|nr:Aerobic cobaltochelatase subunit CobS [Gossypium arboreum]